MVSTLHHSFSHTSALAHVASTSLRSNLLRPISAIISPNLRRQLSTDDTWFAFEISSSSSNASAIADRGVVMLQALLPCLHPACKHVEQIEELHPNMVVQDAGSCNLYICMSGNVIDWIFAHNACSKFFFLQTHVSAPSSGSYVAFGSRIYNSEACLFYYINTYFYDRY
ncbi:hypothetical protein ACB092_11G191900 [Castanea dentata]